MNIKIISQDKVPEMNRTVIKAELIFQGATPSHDEVKHLISKAVKADPDTIIINKISTDFGMSRAVIDALQYDSKEALESFKRRLPKKQREKLEGAAKKAEESKKAAEEAKKEEPKPEEKKE